MRVSVPRISCAVAAVALLACRESSDPPQVQQFNYAIFNADMTSAASGGLTTAPIGFFFRAPALALPNSVGDRDLCQIQSLVASGANLPPFIGAGDSIAFAAEGGSTVYLKPQVDSGITSYRVPDKTPVPVPAGATVTFTVPGTADGFPASSIDVEAVEPYEISPVPDDIPAGQGVPLTWSPDGGTDTRMDVAFMYAVTAGGSLREQLYCSLLDDGEYTVPASFLSGFRAAAGEARRVTSRRWRSSFKDLGESVMLAISSYAAPPQQIP